MSEGAAASPPVLDLRAGPIVEADLEVAVRHVASGGLVAHPTETVYGVGGMATPEAVAALRSLKGRGDEKPFLLLLPSARAAEGLAWTDAARDLASVFWPGPLTLVLGDPAGRFPAGVRSPAGGVAVRVTSHPITRALVERLGAPITSSSANRAGEPPAASGEEAIAVVREIGSASVLVLDAGRLPPSAPSTLVDCTGTVPIVLREGATPIHRLRCVLPGIHGNR